MAQKEKFIKVDGDQVKQIASDFGVTIQAVYKALKFESSSAKAVTLRAAALNRGGKLFEEKEISPFSAILK